MTDYESLVYELAEELRGHPYHEGDKRDIQIAQSRGVFRRNLHQYLKLPYKTVRGTIKHYDL